MFGKKTLAFSFVAISGVTACAGHFSGAFQNERVSPAGDGYNRMLKEEYSKLADFSHPASVSIPRPLLPRNYANAVRAQKILNPLRDELERAIVGPASRTRPDAVATMHEAFNCMVLNVNITPLQFKKCQSDYEAARTEANNAPFPGGNAVTAAPYNTQDSAIQYKTSDLSTETPFAPAPAEAVIMQPKAPIPAENYSQPVTPGLAIDKPLHSSTQAPYNAPAAQMKSADPVTNESNMINQGFKLPVLGENNTQIQPVAMQSAPAPDQLVEQKVRSPYLDSGFGAAANDTTNSLPKQSDPITEERAPSAFNENYILSFNKGGTDIEQKDLNNLNILAEKLKTGAFSEVIIRGHSDQSGSAMLNKKLSFERAEKTGSELAQLVGALPNTKLTLEGYGSSAPIPGKSPFDSANRRAEIILIK